MEFLSLWNFQRDGGSNQKNPLWGEYGYFLIYTVPVTFLDTQMFVEIIVEHYASTAICFICMSKACSCRS